MFNRLHLLGGLLVALAAVVSLVSGGPLWVPALLLTLTDAYLACVLWQVARLGEGRPELIGVPSRERSLVQLSFLLVAVVCAFAQLYAGTGGVVHLVKDYVPGEGPNGAGPAPREVLTDKLDACYFSLVTLTTLGYGDYVPATRPARGLVMWELANSVLLFLFALPLVVSRLSSYR
jgi:hypothetical protein